MLRDEMDLGLVGLTDKESRCEVSFEALVHEALQLKPTRAAVSACVEGRPGDVAN